MRAMIDVPVIGGATATVMVDNIECLFAQPAPNGCDVLCGNARISTPLSREAVVALIRQADRKALHSAEG